MSSLLQSMDFSEVIVNVLVIVHASVSSPLTPKKVIVNVNVNVAAKRASLHLARPKIKLFYSLKMQCA